MVRRRKSRKKSRKKYGGTVWERYKQGGEETKRGAKKSVELAKNFKLSIEQGLGNLNQGYNQQQQENQYIPTYGGRRTRRQRRGGGVLARLKDAMKGKSKKRAERAEKDTADLAGAVAHMAKYRKRRDKGRQEEMLSVLESEAENAECCEKMRNCNQTAKTLTKMAVELKGQLKKCRETRDISAQQKALTGGRRRTKRRRRRTKRRRRRTKRRRRKSRRRRRTKRRRRRGRRGSGGPEAHPETKKEKEATQKKLADEVAELVDFDDWMKAEARKTKTAATNNT